MSTDMPTPPPCDQPSVSVVIATHNRPELLRVALLGVLSQTYAGSIEVVVVFDRSEPDVSLKAAGGLGAWAGPRTVLIGVNDRTPGLAGARNTGILASGHDWIGFCDDDDEWLPGKLNAQFEALGASSASTCVTGITIVYGDHETIRVPPMRSLTLDALTQQRVTEAHPSTVLVLRDHLLERVGLVDEDIPGSYAEDYDWILRAARAGRITVVQEALVRVRWGNSQFSKNWETIVMAIDYLVAKHPELKNSRKGMARLQGRRAFCEAALGHRNVALTGVSATLRLSVREPRAYLTLAVASGLVSADKLLDLAHRRGRGI